MDTINWDKFEKVELIVGTIIEVNDLPDGHKPAYILKVDLGEELGV